MAYPVGKVLCQIQPTPKASCQACGEHKLFFGNEAAEKMDKWAVTHDKTCPKNDGN